MKKFILFDLDGTLLPMDQDVFVKIYFTELAKKMAPLGYKPEELIAGVSGGTKAMVKNEGTHTNEEVFWSAFASALGEGVMAHKDVIEEFYRKEFDAARASCGFNPKAAETVRRLKEKGYTIVLATNPLFPAIATQTRIRWAGLEPEEFEFYTTYEDNSHCKPNLDYYRDIMERLHANAEECIMVGNDVGEDMIVRQLGIDTFLLTDCLINRREEDISGYPQGGFDELMEYLMKLESSK